MDDSRKVQRTLADQTALSDITGRPSRWPWVLLLLVVLAVGVGVTYWLFSGGEPDEPIIQAKPIIPAAPPATAEAKPGAVPPAVPPPSKTGDTVDMAKLRGDKPAQGAPQGQMAVEQAERKKSYGLHKSLDAVVRSDEKLKIGDKTITLTDLEKKLVVESRGEILEKPLGGTQRKTTAWGFHLVRAKENLWEIHFRLFKEFLASKGVKISDRADRPLPSGKSSGVGKILKFAEHMVGVYNLKTGHMSKNLNHLEPGSKLVVFNLSEIFSELSKIDPKDLSGIMYDGRVLLLPKSDGGARTVKVPQS